jgi:predicted ester cyclase
MRLWQGGDLDRFNDLHSPDFVDHSPAGRSPDRDGFRQGIIELYQALPDLKTEIEDLVIDTARQTVAVRWSATGTHCGPLLGKAPTSRWLELRGIEIIRIANGQVYERWGEWDGLDLLARLNESAGSQ